MSKTLLTKLDKVGGKYRGFELTTLKKLPEIDCVLKELRHTQTGASLMHLESDDPENVFCLSFRTYPSTSNGVAHILEHTVLCGSDKYPIKDPFFSMTRRSLNTYMNALTGADFTCYPAASQVPKDFYNILEVYLDAVFHPKLHRLSFEQEGHRLEFRDPEDAKTPLDRQGVVYNEMKGALTSPDSRLWESISQHLFPQVTYGVNSGGDPKDIPHLTHEELLRFHHQYYHPSRCLFFFYGNIKTEDHLDFIAKHALKDVEPLPQAGPLPFQPRFTEPKRVESSYPVAPEEDTLNKTLIGMAWLTTPILNQLEVMSLVVLDTVLMGTDASPLKKAILKSGWCHHVDSIPETDIHEIPYVIICKGCEGKNADPLEKLVRSTLKEIAEKGIEPRAVDSALHQIELERSEITGDHYPHGLNLFMRAGLLKQHHGSAEDALKIHSLFEELRAQFQDPSYLTGLIHRHFLNNPHFVRVTLSPDPNLGKKEADEERASLDAIRARLTEEEAQKIVGEAHALREFQREQEEADHSILPKIGLEEIPPEPKEYELLEEQKGALRVFHHRCFTNKLLDFDLVFPLAPVKKEDLALLQLFTYLWTQMGSAGRPYHEVLDLVQEYTGGFHASLSLNTQARNPHKFQPFLSLSGKALSRKMDPFCRLMTDYAIAPNFSDKERLRELISKLYTGLQQSLTTGALRYAINLSASHLTLPAWVNSYWSGINYFYGVREIALNLDQYMDSLVEKMQEFAQQMLCVENTHLAVSCDGHDYDALVKERFYGLVDLKLHPIAPFEANFEMEPVESQARVIGSAVAFTSRVLHTVPYIHPTAADLAVASNLMDNVMLHKRIREQGGAYGGGTSFNSLSGNFSFYSYRDPNILSTLRAFEDALDAICQGRFEAEDLEEAKIEVIQKLDSPIPPGSRAMTAYMWKQAGLTYATRQTFRHRLLRCTSQEVIAAVRENLFPKLDKSAVVTFTGTQLLERENAILQESGVSPLPALKI